MSPTSKTPDQISTQIRATLSTTVPALSCGLGTPERKIIDAVSEAISEAYIDQYLTGSLLDIETKTGLELEQFAGVFGFGRLQGQQATGVVRVTLNSASPQDLSLPVGTQFYTRAGLAGVSQQLYFASTQAVVITAGSFSVDVPVQATSIGTQGNVPPDSVVSISSINGSASATNLVAMTGGVDVETDDGLRSRFKDTLLRNISGTTDWYQAIALQNRNCSRVVVFGPYNTYRTQIAAPSTTLTVPVNQDVKYVWPQSSSVFTNLGQENEIFYTEVDDYTLTSGASPVFTRVSTGQISTADVVNLEFQYTTKSSRNNPATSITNKVDVYVDGVDPYTITERTVVVSTTLSATSTNPLYTGNFERVGTTGSPSASNRFMRLGSVPIVTFPATITAGLTTYVQGTHYHVLRSITLLAGSQFETSGIEWLVSGPSNGSEVTLTYVYNRVPQLLTAIINHNKQICTDVMVHQAKYKYLKPCINVQFDRSYAVDQTVSAIDSRLKGYYAQVGFGGRITITDLLVVVRQVLGVVNTSLTTSSDDPVHYGIEIYDNATDPTPTSVQIADFKLDDNTLAIFLDADITRQATP